mmetsp:Transcript_8141/g.20200  ORF Transcript_8141/g.20200 Transcript_8141/m.20200 type:complete len:270 (+) Transcript_8141:2483-3292(+)
MTVRSFAGRVLRSLLRSHASITRSYHASSKGLPKHMLSRTVVERIIGRCAVYAIEPRSAIAPRRSWSCPVSAASTDDLPLPTGPTIATSEPAEAWREMPRSSNETRSSFKPAACASPAESCPSPSNTAGLDTIWSPPPKSGAAACSSSSCGASAPSTPSVPPWASHESTALSMLKPTCVRLPMPTCSASSAFKKRCILPSDSCASCSCCRTSGRKARGERSKLTVASTVIALPNVSEWPKKTCILRMATATSVGVELKMAERSERSVIS